MSLFDLRAPDLSPDHDPAPDRAATSDPNHTEPRLQTRNLSPDLDAVGSEPLRRRSPWLAPGRLLAGSALLVLLLAAGALFARHYLRSAARDSLPQLDGTLAVSGLSAPVTVQRDAHGVPHLHAASLDDLVLAQGFVTASDRLFQMDALRRHAAGTLAEVFGAALIPHDRLQRTLQIRAAAERAVAALPPDQLHLLELYARGVNSSIAQQSPHLPVEFRVLRYQPAPWTPRDSMLVAMALFEDLTDEFPTKLARESLSARLPADQRDALLADLFPVGSWRDHPPNAALPDLTIEGPPIEQVPLDESQATLKPRAPTFQPQTSPTPDSILAALHLPEPSPLTPGSNNWAVSGAHTASGKPLLANDMHLSHTVPGIWYEADLQASIPGSPEPFHAAGVSLPGLPLIMVGHNAHIAWGFTNVGADLQDIYIESTRGTGAAQQFQATDGTWQPVLHLPETIRVHNAADVALDIPATHHGDTVTPILNPALAPALHETRTLALRWTLYDPVVLQIPLFAINTAHDWASFNAALSTFGATQNAVYADDAGHIGYHTTGRIPLRGLPGSSTPAPAADTTLPADIAAPNAPPPSADTPTIAANPDPLAHTGIQAPATPAANLLSGALSAVPVIPSAAREWSGYIPYDKLPQVFDPPGGVLATANARVTPDDYGYPITLNWGSSYRTERILHMLAHRTGLKPEDMLALQTDVYSDFDHVLAERLAYALDEVMTHPAPGADVALRYNPAQIKTLRQAADLLRTFSGRMYTDSPAAAITASVHAVLWPMLLSSKLQANKPRSAGPNDPAPAPASPAISAPIRLNAVQINELYSWGERDYALEQILMHTPPRWLPAGFASWNDFLTAAVATGLSEGKAPGDLSRWRYGSFHTLDIEHPIFEQSVILKRLFGMPTGTGSIPQSGDGTTVKQVGRTFGPSERFTADLENPDRSTLNVVLGQSGNPASPWFMDQFPAWLHGTTFPFPFTDAAVAASTTHSLTLTPR